MSNIDDKVKGAESQKQIGKELRLYVVHGQNEAYEETDYLICAENKRRALELFYNVGAGTKILSQKELNNIDEYVIQEGVITEFILE